MMNPSPDISPLLAVRNARKSYNGIPVLVDASLDLQAGEVHALIGENGAGKSTLIKILAGVVNADSISLEMNGTPIQPRDAAHAFTLGFRFIHQELNVIPHLSVAENIFLSHPYPKRAGLFVDWATLNKRASIVLEHLGVTQVNPTQIIGRLSPGEQMLVKIASAFVDDASGESTAQIYIMDEPTAALTGEEAATLFEVINRLKGQGCAILYVSHRLDEVFEISDRMTIMRNGRIIDTQLVAEISTDKVIHMMTGRSLENIFPPRATPVESKPRLEVRNLQNQVLRGITFDLRYGEIIGIAGLNGMGRTELLRALMAIDPIKEGEVILDGMPLRNHSTNRLWQSGVAYVPEERRSQGIILNESISNNVTLPHLKHFKHTGFFVNHARSRSRSEQLGESVRLKAEGAHQHVWQLSGGNQQKVVFARALAQSPRLLLLDEPTRGVDVGAKHDIYQLIREASANGTGILMVSSELSELIGMCDRIMVIAEGRITDIVPADGLNEEALLTLCYKEVAHFSHE